MPSSVSALALSLVVYIVSLLIVPITAQRRTNTSSYLQFPRFTAVPSQLSSEHGLANSHTQIPSLLLAASLLVWGLLALGRWVGQLPEIPSSLLDSTSLRGKRSDVVHGAPQLLYLFVWGKRFLERD
ncbi:hypothetical protein DFH09DRAFT_1071740 [Mycena vulgaris]|nr:hypothetical protein DFH09DRAFT_1071740 [Mycena vulgaris]